MDGCRSSARKPGISQTMNAKLKSSCLLRDRIRHYTSSLKISGGHATMWVMSADKGKHPPRRRARKYVKPVLVKHGLLEAEAAAFSTLY